MVASQKNGKLKCPKRLNLVVGLIVGIVPLRKRHEFRLMNVFLGYANPSRVIQVRADFPVLLNQTDHIELFDMCNSKKRP